MNFFFSSQVKKIPKPIRKVPLKTTEINSPLSFLVAIGRNSVEVADKFKSWGHLFQSNGKKMKKLGLTPKQRKYILWNVNRFNLGFELREFKSKMHFK